MSKETWLKMIRTKVQTPECWSSHSKIMGINIELISLCHYNILHSCQNVLWFVFIHTQGLKWTGADIGWGGLLCSCHYNSSQDCSLGVKIEFLYRPVKFFFTKLAKPFLHGSCFVHKDRFEPLVEVLGNLQQSTEEGCEGKIFDHIV